MSICSSHTKQIKFKKIVFNKMNETGYGVLILFGQQCYLFSMKIKQDVLNVYDGFLKFYFMIDC